MEALKHIALLAQCNYRSGRYWDRACQTLNSVVRLGERQWIEHLFLKSGFPSSDLPHSLEHRQSTDFFPLLLKVKILLSICNIMKENVFMIYCGITHDPHMQRPKTFFFISPFLWVRNLAQFSGSSGSGFVLDRNQGTISAAAFGNSTGEGSMWLLARSGSF